MQIIEIKNKYNKNNKNYVNSMYWQFSEKLNG